MSHPSKERTFVMIKPDGVQRGLVGEILKRVERVGLKITGLKMVLPTEDQCWTHYNKDEAWFAQKGERTVTDRQANGFPVAKPAPE